MLQIGAGLLAGLMILYAALRGLRRGASFVQRLYAIATFIWSSFGAMIYHPAAVARFLPHAFAGSPTVIGVFRIGLLALGIIGATSLMGGGDGL